MIHPELVGTRRSPSVAKGETPLPSMSSSKDLPAPNNGHRRDGISVATATNINGIDSTHPCLPRQIAREGSEKIGRTTSFSNLTNAINVAKTVQEVYGITSFSNFKRFKSIPDSGSRSIWNNKLLKPQKSAIASEIRRLRPLGRHLLSFNIIHRFARRRQQSCTNHR